MYEDTRTEAHRGREPILGKPPRACGYIQTPMVDTMGPHLNGSATFGKQQPSTQSWRSKYQVGSLDHWSSSFSARSFHRQVVARIISTPRFWWTKQSSYCTWAKLSVEASSCKLDDLRAWNTIVRLSWSKVDDASALSCSRVQIRRLDPACSPCKFTRDCPQLSITMDSSCDPLSYSISAPYINGSSYRPSSR